MNKFLTIALEAARESEKVILEYFDESGVSVEMKSDNSPVTVADKKAEHVIHEVVRSYFPDHGFLGEETGESDTNSEYTWIVDPIDGTRNYSHGIPIFDTQIALMKGEELILGVSNAPALRELLYAEKGKGAYCNDAKIHVSSVQDIDKAFISFGGIRHFEQKKLTVGLVSLANAVNGDHGFGDFWSYTLVARGSMDIMIDPKVNIWDVAALTVILEEAGGVMTDTAGGPITKKVQSVIASNGILHARALSYFN